MSRLPGACSLALVIACAVDFYYVAGPRSPLALLCAAGLAIAVGFGLGSAARLALWLLGFLPKRLAMVAWPVTMLAAASWLAERLGAYKRLHGVYASFAIAVLVICAGAAIACSLLLCALQPTGTQRRAALPERSPGTRGYLSLALVLVVSGLCVADRTLYVDLYSIGHAALRVGVLALATIALAISHEWCWVPIASRSALIGVALTCAGLLIALDEKHPALLQASLARPWPSFALDAARGLVDLDRDGYASLLGGGDCAPFDPRVHPGAREIPENGIDDNCALGDARRRAATSADVVMPGHDSPLDIVLITVDSLRRDRVGVYAKRSSGQRVLTPNLDRWAAGATVFDRAYAPGGWTSLSLPALMRGVYPRRLRWRRFYETNAHRLLRAPLAPQLRKGEEPAWLFAFPANDGYRPLAERLSQRGMNTVAVVDDGRSEILRPGTGIERGFGEYIEINPGAVAIHDDSFTSSRAIAAMSRARSGRGVFMWVHFFGVHGPSEHHPGTPRYGSSVADRYDHEVRFFDTQLARLLAALDHRSRPTAVFLSADHGEELESRVRHHGYSVAEEVISVPLIARVPGWSARHSRALVNLVDLTPTILALTQTPVPGGLDGIDLSATTSETASRDRVVMSDTWRFDVDGRLVADMVGAYDGRHKLVVDELGYGSYLSDQTQPALPPVLRFGAALDRLSRAAYGYLEDTGGMPAPSD